MMKENYSWWRPENNKHFQFWIMGWLNMNHPKVAESVEIDKYKNVGLFLFVFYLMNHHKNGQKGLALKETRQ